ncbi:hypothetical protein IMSAG025_00178 [Muribaculaceae bacterium]|nr:hypothetical protein IMSAGC016_01414 [Muribaculaceae bacterium]GFI56751.1 hypothetical protein IMSAG025_00178 [Muribaculaceae bacterium]
MELQVFFLGKRYFYQIFGGADIIDVDSVVAEYPPVER